MAKAKHWAGRDRAGVPALAAGPDMQGFSKVLLVSEPLDSEMEKCLLPGTLRAEREASQEI